LPRIAQELALLAALRKGTVQFVCKAKAFTFANVKITGNQEGSAAAGRESDRQAGTTGAATFFTKHTAEK
jgi:hypothetical protein